MVVRRLKSRKLGFILALLFVISSIVPLKFITYSSAEQASSKRNTLSTTLKAKVCLH